MKIFVINGHKYYSYAQGRLNQTLFDEIVKLVSVNNEVQTTIVEQGYDVKQEQDKFIWADIIIYQTPVNWYALPWIFKKYVDEVFGHGIFFGGSLKYGDGGKLKDKKYMLSLTWNSPIDAFEETYGFYDGRSPDDVWLPFHKANQYCGMSKIETFNAFNVVRNPDIDRFLNELNTHINKYVLDTRND